MHPNLPLAPLPVDWRLTQLRFVTRDLPVGVRPPYLGIVVPSIGRLMRHREMAMRRYSSIAAVVALALVGASCGDSTDPATSVAVRASLDRTQYRAGDTVSVPVEVENIGDRAVRISGNLAAFLEIRNAAGKVVFFGRSGAFAMVGYPPRVLEPGELVSDRPFWAGVVVGPASSVAEPGTYRVRAAVRVLAARDYAFSSPLEVTIVP